MSQEASALHPKNPSGKGLRERTLDYGRMIKFSHTVFALPFALSAVVLAWQTHPVSLWDLAWILVAMVGARSAAMGFNRIADAAIDAKNPRTAVREIPSGVISIRDTMLFVGLSSALFILAAAMLSPLCLLLSFPVLLALFFYSLTKRFTRFCHLYLGFAISLAPVGAWIAVTDSLAPGVVFLAAGLWTYIAGFDILYACQDIDFDREQGLFSLPVHLGPRSAMAVSSVLHLMTLGFLLAAFFAFAMHPVFLVFLGVIGAALVIEHRLVNPNDLSRINLAFFHMNSIVSMALLVGVLAEVACR